MKFTLTRPLQQYIHFEGRRYRLNLAFDNVLRVFEVQRDPLFTPAQRVHLAVELLIGRRAARRLPFGKLSELLSRISAEFLSPKTRPVSPGGPRVLDWTQDAPLIYAAFLQAYGIDLIKQRGRLDWRVFLALFQALPESTKIREVMGIRRCDLPAPDKYNADQIKKLIEAKQYYAIELSEEEAQANLQAGLDRFGAALVSRAKRGD